MVFSDDEDDDSVCAQVSMGTQTSHKKGLQNFLVVPDALNTKDNRSSNPDSDIMN